MEARHFDSYDIVVEIEHFRQLANGGKGWRVRFPALEEQLISGAKQPNRQRLISTGAAAVARASFFKETSMKQDVNVQVAVNDDSGQLTGGNLEDQAETAGSPRVLYEATHASGTSHSKFERGSPRAFSTQQHSSYNTTFVTVLGLYNRGKTYVLNQLGRCELPHGCTLRTQGISMKTLLEPGLQQFTLIDIAGFDSPVKVMEGDHSVSDKKCMDRFIEDVVLKLATICIVVVNDMTLADQLYLENLRRAWHRYNQQYSSFPKTATGTNPQPKFDDLIVVHNFVRINELSECKRAFDEQVVSNYQGKCKTHILKRDTDSHGEFYYTKSVQGDKVGMRHVFIGRCTKPMKNKMWNVMKPVGKHNRSVFDMIGSWLQSVAKENEVHVLQEMVQCSNDLLPRYFEKPPHVDLHQQGEGPNSYTCICCSKPWTVEFDRQPFAKAVLNPGVWLLPRFAEVRVEEEAAENHPSKPTYDILHRPHNVYILMNLMKPPPHIQFDAASRLCTVTGEIKEPPIVRQEGSTMPVRRRYYGEFELKIELNKLLPHEVALVYNGCYEDNESWFFYIEFDKIKPVSEGGKVSEKLLKS